MSAPVIRFVPGQKVLTASEPKGDQDWCNAGERRLGQQATILTVHDSHGLCYVVTYEDGEEGSFNHEELTAI